MLLVALVPIKVALFFGLLTRFHLQGTNIDALTSLSLASYSEFGLIVGAVGVSAGWLSDQWLMIIAVAVAATFIIASPLNAAAPRIYDRFRSRLLRFQSSKRLPEERPIYVPKAEVLILGMGRVGTGTYDALVGELGDRVAGVDVDPDIVQRHVDNGRNVVRGDPTDLDVLRAGDQRGQAQPRHARACRITKRTSLRQLSFAR